MESREYRGTWWLPERPDDDLRGKLTFSPDKGAILALEGRLLAGPMDDRNPRRIETPIIHGLVGMQEFTLKDCFGSIEGLFVSSMTTLVGAKYVFLGGHFDTRTSASIACR